MGKVEAARRVAPVPEHPLDTSSLDDGPEIQLSVRVPEGLRSAFASTAAAQEMTTAFSTAAQGGHRSQGQLGRRRR